MRGETLLGADDAGNPVSLGTNTWRTGLNNNLLVLGPSGAGKTCFVLKPNLLQLGASYIVLDTKGTLDEEVEPVLAAHGYEVWSLDFAHDMAGTVGYDPLRHIWRGEDAEGHAAANDQDVLAVASAICPIENRDDPFWDRMASQVLACLPDTCGDRGQGSAGRVSGCRGALSGAL